MDKENLEKIKVIDKIRLYEKTNKLVATNFLDPREVFELESIYKNYPHSIFGGYDEAERKLLVIGDDEANFEEYISVIEIETSSKKELSHREVLGSILGLGIKRDVVGDIIINGTKANVFITKDILKYIIQNLEKIGREKAIIKEIKLEEVSPVEKELTELKTTVASLRIDAIVSSCYGISREESAILIKNGKVNLNYKEVQSSSKQVKEGDLISVRGFGRFVLESVLGETRKDRIRVVINKYGK